MVLKILTHCFPGHQGIKGITLLLLLLIFPSKIACGFPITFSFPLKIALNICLMLLLWIKIFVWFSLDPVVYKTFILPINVSSEEVAMHTYVIISSWLTKTISFTKLQSGYAIFSTRLWPWASVSLLVGPELSRLARILLSQFRENTTPTIFEHINIWSNSWSLTVSYMICDHRGSSSARILSSQFN